jgi:hypothetical protein
MIEIRRTEIASPPDLARRFVHVRALPWGERPLAYELVIPKEFEAATDLALRTPAPGEFMKIGTFRGPAAFGANATIDVAATRLGREVSLADFFEWLRERYGLEVSSVDAIEYGDREAVDALASWTPAEGGRRISRFVLFRHNDRLVRVSGTAPAEAYEPLAEPFAVALSTFKFLEREPSPFTEPFEWTSSRGAMPLGFRRPAVWRAVERTDVPWGRQVIELTRFGSGAAEAYLRVAAIDRDLWGEDLEALARNTAQELRTVGFEPRALIQRLKPKSPGFPFEPDAVEHVYEGRAFGGPCSVRIACLESPRALYSVGVVAPTRTADAFAWMGAKRAFEVVLLSLNRPGEEILRPPGLARIASAPPAAAPGRRGGGAPAEERRGAGEEE